MNNFEPGINPVGYGVGINGFGQSPLLGMLSQLFQKRLSPQYQTLGANQQKIYGANPVYNTDQFGNVSPGTLHLG
jgi:hypothetical protein